MPAPLAETGLPPEVAHRIARTANACLVVIAVASGVLSYHGLYALGVRSALPPALAALLPVLVDGLMLAASVSVIAETLSGLSTVWSWCLIAAGVAMSTAGNVLAAPDDLVARVVHGAPPVILAASIETCLRLARHRAGRRTRGAGRRQQSVEDRLPATVSEQTTGVSPVAPKATPKPRTPRTGGTTIRDQVAAILTAEPELTAGEIARRLGRDPASVRKAVRALRETETARPTLHLATTEEA